MGRHHEKDRGKKIYNYCAYCGKLHVLYGEDMERAINTGYVGTICKKCLAERRQYGALTLKRWGKVDISTTDTIDETDQGKDDENYQLERAEELCDECTGLNRPLKETSFEQNLNENLEENETIKQEYDDVQMENDAQQSPECEGEALLQEIKDHMNSINKISRTTENDHEHGKQAYWLYIAKNLSNYLKAEIRSIELKKLMSDQKQMNYLVLTSTVGTGPEGANYREEIAQIEEKMLINSRELEELKNVEVVLLKAGNETKFFERGQKNGQTQRKMRYNYKYRQQMKGPRGIYVRLGQIKRRAHPYKRLTSDTPKMNNAFSTKRLIIYSKHRQQGRAHHYKFSSLGKISKQDTKNENSQRNYVTFQHTKNEHSQRNYITFKQRTLPQSKYRQQDGLLGKYVKIDQQKRRAHPLK